MPKIFNAVLVFSLLITFSTVALAQESDYEGIDPIVETPPTINDPVTPPEETTGTLEDRINNLILEEQSNFQIAKTNYSTTLMDESEGTQYLDSPSPKTYKLNTILVSARYHRTLALYATYLQYLNQSVQNSDNSDGFGSNTETSKAELEYIITQIETTASSLRDFDNTVASFNSYSQINLVNFAPEVRDKSTLIKDDLESIRLDLLDLVELIK